MSSPVDIADDDVATWSLPGIERRNAERRQKSVDSLVNLVTALRWGTTTASLLWAAALRVNIGGIGAGLVLVSYAIFRTFRPIEYRRRGWLSLVSILFELFLTTLVIVATGCWDSPYIFALFTPVIAAGFARGFWHALRIGFTGGLAVGLAALTLNSSSGIRTTTTWCGEILLTAIIASYGRHLLSRAEEFRALNMSQLWRLNTANGLLVNLNRLAHDLPASFDFAETVERAITETRDLAPSDFRAILTLDPISPLWSVASAEGVELPESFIESQLPSAVRTVARQQLPQLIDTMSSDYAGLAPDAKSGLYVPLWAGHRQVGLLALESTEPNRFGLRHATALQEIAESLALTIDNARWFDRLRARGAAQERNRIARDLHDRLGQEVAYVAFELERLQQSADGSELGAELAALRDNARSIVQELRETLYDLRTDVTHDEDLIEVMRRFLERVKARSGIHTRFQHDVRRTLPLAQEREVWRIAQESIANAERHADATAINVSWTVDADGAELVIADDGIGMQPKPQTHPTAEMRPSYGIMGMRERAESIGGLLEIEAGNNVGTIVRLRLGARRQQPAAQQEEVNHV